MTDENKLPNPGSYEALEMGCRCPMYDNNKGLGCDWGNGLFWINPECPLHGKEAKRTEEDTRTLMEKLQTTYHKGEGQ